MKSTCIRWTLTMDELLQAAIDKEESASTAARWISLHIGAPVTRHMAIGRAHRQGWRFHSDRELTHEHIYNRPAKHKSRAKAVKRVAVKIVAPPPIPTEPLPQGPLNDFPDRRDACRYPHGNTAGGPWRCCAATAREGSSYCDYHNKRCNNGLTTHQARFAKPNFSVPGWAA